MCRGDLKEPYHRLTNPQAEWGWSWEDFALGGIINPFDRTSARISFLMGKVWLSDKVAYTAGGKQWTAVPMAWISMPASAYAIMSVTTVKTIIEPTAVSNADHTNSSSPLVTRVAKVVDFIDTVTIAAWDVRMPVNVLKRTQESITGDADGGFQAVASRSAWRRARVRRVTHLLRSVARFFVHSSI
ncbi:uncharacterized protein K441DRAFT_677018 [Cenococcum geophilum 1.58]|uniref:uncharacterized protein n=1 Tax=Cenococcum geophilum 1.58 TaxID=794803 RepID=UPI00358DEB71|nr:hypothetical protein K441DRAFT_677018 [Cenococcum geophilum 1.58]